MDRLDVGVEVGGTSRRRLTGLRVPEVVRVDLVGGISLVAALQGVFGVGLGLANVGVRRRVRLDPVTCPAQ